MKRATYIPIGIAVVASAYLFITKQTLYNQVLNLNNELKDLKSYHLVTKNMLFSAGQFVNLNFDPKMNLTNKEGEQIKLKDIISHRKVLYRFNESNCFSCVENFIPYLKNMRDRIGNNIVIIGSFHKDSELFVQMQRFKLDIPIYNLKPEHATKLNKKLATANVPHIFILDSSYSTSQFFIPEKGIPELSKNYCEQITKIFTL